MTIKDLLKKISGRIKKYQGLLRPSKIARMAKRLLNNPDKFLDDVSGVIHIGASTGQERKLYSKNNLDVIWVEPIPDAFARLEKNISKFPRQHAYQYLITDKDNETYSFNVASNSVSSSILDLGLHKDVHPDVSYIDSIDIKSLTLATMVRKENINTDTYDALIMDTQGTELLVLKGAESLLGKIRYIKTEAADFEAYKDCCQLSDLEDYLHCQGYTEYSRTVQISKDNLGSFYDIVFKREKQDV